MSAINARASTFAAGVGRLQTKGPVLQVVALVVLFVYGTATISGFNTQTSINSMLVLAALLGLAAIGQSLVIILMGIDFSIPGFIVGGAVLISELCGTHGWPFLPAMLLAIILAGLLGGLVGWICFTFRIQPLIVTLGMNAFVIGISLVATGGRIAGTPPSFLTNITSPTGTTFGFIEVPPVVLIWAVVIAGMAYVLHRTRLGRWIFATGANPRAAQLARVPTQKIWTGVFATSAICSALVGILLAGFAGADQTIGDPYLFTGLTAVIIGGLAFGGAHGDYTTTALGALILTVLQTILVGNGLETAEQQIIYGLLILLVVAGYGRDRRVQDRI